MAEQITAWATGKAGIYRTKEEAEDVEERIAKYEAEDARRIAELAALGVIRGDIVVVPMRLQVRSIDRGQVDLSIPIETDADEFNRMHRCSHPMTVEEFKASGWRRP